MSRFGGFGGGMNMQQMMKQAQKLQEEIMRARQELEEMEIEGSSGGGMVTAVVSGSKKLLRISINPNVVDVDDIEMLEDLILSAYNTAFEKAEEEYAARIPEGL